MISETLGIFAENIGNIPLYHLVVEIGLLLLIVWLFFKKSYKIADGLTEKEKDDLIAEWEPEPLVPPVNSDHSALHSDFINGKVGKHVEVNGERLLNLACNNFLGLLGNERIEEAAKNAIYKYGVGSCGPRGFYGTVDVHLKLEEELAQFLNCEEAVLYSYGFSTIASAIPAYSKLGDVIFADKESNFAIQKGLQASRSRIEWFEHNDPEDLERLLKIQAAKDKQNPSKAKVTRRFMIFEGISQKFGDIAPLPKYLELKWKYKVRIFVDESYSFGVLGASGKGLTEHYGVNVEDVDMICASLENAIASTGGFCAGRTFVVDHQRLSGIGYCFSASLPPLLAVAASKALEIIQEDPSRIHRLQENSTFFVNKLKNQLLGSAFKLDGESGSPLCHIRWLKDPQTAEDRLNRFVAQAKVEGILLTRARYLNKEEIFATVPSIRIAINAELDEDELDDVIATLRSIALSLS